MVFLEAPALFNNTARPAKTGIWLLEDLEVPNKNGQQDSF